MPALVHAILFDDVDWQRVRQVEDLRLWSRSPKVACKKIETRRYASADDSLAIF